MPLEQLKHWFAHLTDNSPFLFAVLDTNHSYHWVSQRYSELSGLHPDELAGKNDRQVLGNTFYQTLKPYYQQALKGQSGEGEVLLNDGTQSTCLHFCVAPLIDPEGPGNISGIILHASDTSERQILSTALEAAESKFTAMCQVVSDGCLVIRDGSVISSNDSAARLLGFSSPDRLLGQMLDELFIGQELSKNLTETLTSATPETPLFGEPRHLSRHTVYPLSYIPLSQGTVQEGMLIIRQDCNSEEVAKNTAKLINSNPLTGLYNRQGFSRCLEQFIANNARMVMLYLDIDNFKNINDSLGHHIGDKVLQDISQRLFKALPEGAIIGHLSGDEFAVILPDLESDEAINSITEQLISVIRQPFELHHFSKFLTCSIGSVSFPQDGKDVKSLLQNADTAMYEAKERGRNQLVPYHQNMNKEARMRLWLEIELQKVLQNKGLEVWYQPKVNAHDHSINGAEALVRWKHPVEGYISPGRFIPVAERSGMIEQLGINVMREVFEGVHNWQKQGILPGRVAINLSPQQFRNPNLLTQMSKMLQASNINPSMITFELTESAVMNDSDHTIQMLNGIKKMGFTLSIDDFGTGYSSLSYLARFPLDELKIDRTFIMEMDALPKQVTLIENIINLGRSLDMTVVAEGVETSAQANKLARLNCDSIQGFHFYRPMPKEEFETLLQQNKKPRLAALPSPDKRQA
ncbi:c-di-GMP phosphodiesterase [Veronia pacifica]|uniref:cyclic-guanylate-specific phosphodiesterase n=2 Tax=Veronia pacifica TaxID=1080227 RepID=A0A1C3EK44_9GAMM|nr:EAL domain-containing protein [Veronia pacifica]ODA33604.1 c-di-GMP phosphodiesterase [Veronia pacifica]